MKKKKTIKRKKKHWFSKLGLVDPIKKKKKNNYNSSQNLVVNDKKKERKRLCSCLSEPICLTIEIFGLKYQNKLTHSQADTHISNYPQSYG